MLLRRLAHVVAKNNPRLAFVRRASSATYTVSSHGDASSVLSLEHVETSPSPSEGKLVVNWLAAGVDPLDLAAVRGERGASGFMPSSLPAVPGSEGVAIVEKVGSGVSSIKPGDYVIPIKTSIGTWRETGEVSESQVLTIPDGTRIELAATLSTSPFLAYRLLSDFGSLSPGDVVVQNEASGPVGTAIVQIASMMGLKTVSLVNETSANYAPTVERLKLMGGDVVVGESYVQSPGFQAVLDDMPVAKLAINSGSTESCAILANLVGQGGTIVTHSTGNHNATASKSKGLKDASFSIADWLENCSRDDAQAMTSRLIALIDKEGFTGWLQKVKFDELQPAIKAGGRTRRKLVAVMPRGLEVTSASRT